MALNAIYFLDQKYRLALDGESWVIQKSNKIEGTCILFLKIKERISSYDWVPLISFYLFISITINISFLSILVDIQVLVLHWP